MKIVGENGKDFLFYLLRQFQGCWRKYKFPFKIKLCIKLIRNCKKWNTLKIYSLVKKMEYFRNILFGEGFYFFTNFSKNLKYLRLLHFPKILY